MKDASPEMLSIFHAALERLSAEDRAAYLDAACGQDRELRERIEALLRAHEQAGGFLAEKAAISDPRCTVDDESSTQRPGVVLDGRYKLLEEIGEGGMGSVWMAQQTEPVKRLVAVKLVKAGMDSRQVIARFEAERQALALMDHANIGRVLDAGTTSAGRPYFVMDLVKGVPITRYCDEHRLTPLQRLELFIPVCQAVQHAHQKGIIHRDIKPSNVLVALYDGKPVPKVIDFGVAKAAGHPLTEKTLVTGFGAIVGTLEYMSPEQAEVNQLDIDTRSDIYSLGVLLYELLTGSPPFTRKDLEKAGMLEMLRVIREQEPSRPSTKLSTAEGLPTLAANRGTEPAKLTRLVRGELDWIVMKALEKDRSRRYETANGFAMDVQRYLADEPVQACPPSVGYRVGKFIRRHKLALGTAALVSASLLLAVVVLAVSNVRIQEESQATAAEKEAKENALADKLRAEQKRREEEEKKKEEAEGRARANDGWKQTAYYQKTARILAECQRSNLALAEELLAECPQELRRWEWDYLSRLSRAELRRVAPSGLTNWRDIVLSPGATHLASVDGAVVRVHDLATGKETLAKPATGFGQNVSVRFGPGGKLLGLYGWSRNEPGNPVTPLLQVWDAATGKECLVAKGTAEKGGRNDFWSIAFNHRLPHVSAADQRGRVLTFDLETGKEVWRIDAYPKTPTPPPNHSWYTALVYSPDGTQLISECEGAEIKAWDAATGKFLRTLKGGERSQAWLTFSPKGTWLILVGPEREVRLCDPVTGETKRSARGFDLPITAVAFSRDEKRLAIGTSDGRVGLWDLTTGREIGAYRTAAGNTHRVMFTAAGDQLATINIRAAPIVQFWDATRGAEARVLAPVAGYRAVFSPDGRRVAATAANSATNSFHVFVWDADTGQELHRLGDEGDIPFAVAWSSDGAFLAAAVTSSRDLGMVKVWDARTGQCVRILSDPRVPLELSSPLGFALGTAGMPLGTAAQSAVALHLLREKAQSVRQGAPCDAVAWSANGRYIASGGQDRVVRLWDAATGKQLWESKSFWENGAHDRSISGLVFSSDGRRLVSATGGIERAAMNKWNWPPDMVNTPPDLKVWDVVTGKELLSLTLRDKTEALALSPDGQTLAVAFGNSMTAFRKTWVFGAGAAGEQRSVEVWENALGDKSVRFYSLATGEEVRRIKGHARPTRSIAFSPDGLRLVTAGGADESLKLWDPNTGEEILTLGPHRGIVTSVAFSNDGKRIVSASQQDVRVWDAMPLKK
jgi:WD40 repeat protein/serine/threonine protein kinase